MPNTLIRAERAPWNEFPAVITNGPLNSLSIHPEYAAAKAGDPRAAFMLAEKVITDEYVEQVREALGGRRPKILPVMAVEASGRNKIPLMAAKVLAHRLGLEVEMGIFQSGKAFRTNSGADHRLVFNPVFAGNVEAGAEYVILDDTLAMGGTLAALRGYVENRGGHVVLGTVMTAHEGALQMPVKPAMLEAIERKHGDQMNALWHEEFGYGIEQLTQGEAGHLKKAPDVEHMRERIRIAREQGLAQFGADIALSARVRSTQAGHEPGG